MGITGLLPFLKKASKKSHLRHFSGSVVAVDGSCWLHKGAFGCAQKLGTGEPTTAYVTYFIKYVDILRDNGLRPIIVFDGRSLPSKEGTNKKRREKREENRLKAKEALRVGNKREAWECFQRAIEITPVMVQEVIKVLRERKLDYIISPYEADAQLAYLANKGIVDLIITEDSDLVLFGCPKIFFKLNVNGDGVVFDSTRLHLCMDQTPERFDFERFRQMCIFSGCDYLDSISGIGLGRAKTVFTLTLHHELELILQHAPMIVNIDIVVTEEYITEFRRAENTFRYQLVFDPMRRELCPLTPYSTSVDKEGLSYCGKYESPQLSLDMALGNVDNRTLKKVANFNIDDPKCGYYTEKSMWSTKFKNAPRVIKTLTGKVELRKSPKKTLVVSSAAIWNRLLPNAKSTDAAIPANDDGIVTKEPSLGEEEDEIYGKSLLGMRCRSPSPKRARLRTLYSPEKKKKLGRAQNTENCEAEVQILNGIEDVPGTGHSTTSDSDDSCFIMKLRPRNPFVTRKSVPVIQKSLFAHRNGVKPTHAPRPTVIALCPATSSKKNEIVNDNNKESPTSPQRQGVQILVQEKAVVVIEKLDSKEIKTGKCRSRYFTRGTSAYLGTKNHPLYSATTSKKRTSLF